MTLSGNIFDIRTKAVVLWSPTLLISSDNGTQLVAKHGDDNSVLEFRADGQKVMCIRHASVPRDRKVKIGRVAFGLADTQYSVIEFPNSTTLATVQRDSKSGWVIQLPSDRIINIRPASSWFARLLREKWLQRFRLTVDEREIGTMRERFFPLGQKVSIDLSADFNEALDRRIAVAAGCLVMLGLSQILSSPTV